MTPIQNGDLQSVDARVCCNGPQRSVRICAKFA